jgi:23S rRNA pseudouridine1911/1915/1917 synthase
MKHPVFGDQLYNGRETQLMRLPENLRKRGQHLLKMMPRQALHAKELTFLHPRTGERVRFEAPLPDDMQAVLEKLPDMLLLPTEGEG